MPGKRPGLPKEIAFALTLILWAAAAWLLYPLVTIDNVDMGNVKVYLYRSALGITILLIFFGKTLHDLIFPWVTARAIPRLNAVLLTLYLVLLSGGIVFVVVRMALLLMKNRQKQGFIF
jgi:hypothetical protein